MVLGEADCVEVAARARHELLRLHALELRKLIAVLRGALEVELRGRLLHALAEPLGHDVAAALEEQDRVLEVARVVLLRDQADARRGAALDLVLQARPAPILEVTVLAAPELEELLELAQRLAHRARVRVRAEQLRFARARTAVEREPRKGVIRGQLDVRIALVVAQHDVEPRPMLLDQVVLEHQRFGLGARDRDLDARDRAHHRDGLRVLRAPALEIARHALAQVARLADVDHLARRVEHPIDAGLVREVLDGRVRIERCRGRRLRSQARGLGGRSVAGRGGVALAFGVRLPRLFGADGGLRLSVFDDHVVSAASPRTVASTSANICAVKRRVCVL